MKIAVASGKGGTGKTTVSVNLALSLGNAQLLDCDVEEPNCNLFLGHRLRKLRDVGIQIPSISKDNCTLCGKCAETCRFNALAVVSSYVMVFPRLCHGCGACSLVCPHDAISAKIHIIGSIESTAVPNSGTELYRGILNIGEPMASPVIRALKEHIDDNRTVIIDSPPGTSCPVISSISGADYCVLVTEPTPFGLHDLMLAIELVKEMQIPHGVIINRHSTGSDPIEDYCSDNDITVLMKIPYEKRIAELYSEGVPFIFHMPQWKDSFLGMFRHIQALTGRC